MKLINSIVICLLLSSCATDKYVTTVNKSLPKTVMIEVDAVIKEIGITITRQGKFSIEQSTAPITVQGSGVFISKTGHILTCAHLFSFESVEEVRVHTWDGGMKHAEVLHTDDRKDLALIKVDSRSVPAKLVKLNRLAVGQEVIAIGNPLGFDWSVTHGIISALNRDGSTYYDLTQSDTFINPGNSGGPLFNLRGELVGINSRLQSPVRGPIFTGCGFSVSPNEINKFLTSVKKKYEGLW